MEYFVNRGSIVREIWGKSDTILFIFAGAASEFALNKAVDWLYFTGKLPADPLGRLFSTVEYARHIVFSEKLSAIKAIDKINAIHGNVESARGAKIPDWAYRDVLFMLVDYAIRSYELLERQLSDKEKDEVFEVFFRMGSRMGVGGLPGSYADFVIARKAQLKTNLVYSKFTADLYKQYYKNLGFVRYHLLMQVQGLLIPEEARKLLGLKKISVIKPVIGLYKLSRQIRLDRLFKALLLPPEYKVQIRKLDIAGR